MPPFKNIESYKQNGSSFHLSIHEAKIARDGIDGFYSHVTHIRS